MSLGRLDILLVRHAEAVPAGTPGWEERDNDRPLTDAGLQTAEELADELSRSSSPACTAARIGARSRPWSPPPSAGACA
jgi:broad specificity phosphatase PhoE